MVKHIRQILQEVVLIGIGAAATSYLTIRHEEQKKLEIQAREKQIQLEKQTRAAAKAAEKKALQVEMQTSEETISVLETFVDAAGRHPLYDGDPSTQPEPGETRSRCMACHANHPVDIPSGSAATGEFDPFKQKDYEGQLSAEQTRYSRLHAQLKRREEDHP